MKSQIPGNSNNQRFDPRFGGRGHGRGQTNSSMFSGPGIGGHHRVGGPRQMNGGRGAGPMNNFPMAGRGASHQVFGRGRTGNFQHQHSTIQRNQKNLHQNHNNSISHGPPAMRGGPSPAMTGRGRMNMGYNSFNDGRGRGRNNYPGRNTFGGRGGQQHRPPPPPPRGRGIGQGMIFPPPPPPPQQASHLPRPRTQPEPTSLRNPISQPFQKEIMSQSTPYGVTPGLMRGNQVQQPQNGYQQQNQQQFKLPSQQHSPLSKNSTVSSLLPHEQFQQHQQQLPRATNNSSYGNYQQVTNPAHKPYDQRLFQPGNTGTFQINLKQQPSIITTASNNASTAAVATPSTRQIEQAWKEYTAPGGVKYYHNELLKESTYQMPDALKKNVTAISFSSTPATATTSSSQKRPWQEHEDANTGRKYYSDGVQTTWEKPEGFVSPETIVANTTFSSKREEQNVHEGPAKKKKRVSNVLKSSTGEGDSKASVFKSKKEATTAFKGFLLAKGISPTLKWSEVLKLCESDSRWNSFEGLLSLGERRQALAEYQTKRTNELRNEQRQERIRAKEAFGQLLADVLPSISAFSARTSRFADVRDALSKDDKFFAIEDESTRESLFLDFCDDFKKREERNKRNKKREAEEAFISFLQEREDGGTLTYASTWESFLLSLSEEDKLDSRFVTTKSMSDSDRQLYFADFVIALQKAEDDKRRRIQDARRRAEKAQRDQYRELLHQKAVDGKIFPYSRWREIETFIIEEDSFKLVEGQDRGAPREIFELFVEGWDEVYRRERNFLSRLLRPPGRPDIMISAGTTCESFKKILAEESAYSSEIQNETFRIVNREDPVSSARLLFDELTARTGDIQRNGGSRRGSTNDDSSEDEGEIIEDGEVADNDCNDAKSNELQ